MLKHKGWSLKSYKSGDRFELLLYWDVYKTRGMENGFPFGWQVPDGIVGFFCGVKRYSTDFFPPMCIDALRCKKSSHFTPQLGKRFVVVVVETLPHFFWSNFYSQQASWKNWAFFAFLPHRKIEWNLNLSRFKELWIGTTFADFFFTSSFEYLYEYQVQEHFHHNFKEDVKIWNRKSCK